MRRSGFLLSVITVSLALTSAGELLAAPPGVPQIDWMETEFALIEVDQSTSVYADLVTVKESVQIPVSWSKWSGEAATTAEYRLDGETVLRQAVSGGGSQSGSGTLEIDLGGRYRLTVALCNSDGCSESSGLGLVVADTDGSHLDPLVLSDGEHHQPYDNTSGRVVGASFVEWGVYGRAFPVDRVPAYNLTNLFYCFIPICGGDGINDSLKQIGGTSFSGLQRACAGSQDFEVAIHDPWAALQKPQAGHSWSTPYKGNFGQLMALKRAYPELKVIPSVGGWSLSDPFYFMGDPAIRHRFVDSVEGFLRTWKFFDGVDIDWEYPGGKAANPLLGDPATDGETYLQLMRELRAMLDRIELDTGRELILSSAVSADPKKTALVDFDQAQRSLDLILAMTYDFYGAWSNAVLGHHTALYAPEFDPGNDFNADTGVRALLQQGVEPSKIALGVAMYGRGWTGVRDFHGNPFTGVAAGPVAGTWEPGAADYRDIAENMTGAGWEYGYDSSAEGAYVFNPATGDLVTFDDATSVRAKGGYVDELGLAGLFAWEIDADNGDILNAMHEGLGHSPADGSNRAPIADAGVDQRLYVPALVTLDASGSRDPDGDRLSYRWRQSGGPTVVLSATDRAQVTFEAGRELADTTTMFELSVSDGALSTTDTIRVELLSPQSNQAPVVSLPARLSVPSGGTLSIAAEASDPDGDLLSYSWSLPGGLGATGLADEILAVSAPEVSANTEFSIQVRVSDGDLEAVASTVLTVEAASTGGCRTTDPAADDYPAWDAGTVYVAGDTAGHQQLVWQAKYWTRGNEPGPGSDPWRLISDVELGWSPERVYLGGEQVNHDGRRWQARWWTRGDEPGRGQVWVDIGSATCS